MQQQNIDKAMDAILNAIDVRIEMAIKQLNFDITKKGIVKKVNDNNTYQVFIGRDEYNIPAISWRQFKVNDICIVVFPQNNINEAFIM